MSTPSRQYDGDRPQSLHLAHEIIEEHHWPPEQRPVSATRAGVRRAEPARDRKAGSQQVTTRMSGESASSAVRSSGSLVRTTQRVVP